MNYKSWILAPILFAFFSGYGQNEKKLAQAFIQSLNKKNFILLNPYLPTTANMKTAFGSSFSLLPAAKQADSVRKIKNSILKSWVNTLGTIKKNKIDLSKIYLNQVETTPIGPDKDNSILSSLLVTYFYNGQEWDDLLFTINTIGPKFMLNVASTTEIIDSSHDSNIVFGLNDKARGKNLEKLAMEKERTDPSTKDRIELALEGLRQYALDNNIAALIAHQIYKGDEHPDQKWKRELHADDANAKTDAKKLVATLKVDLTQCHLDLVSYKSLRVQKNTEGIWYILPFTCGGKQLIYSFLKINDVLLLANIERKID
jgi:hypothetical protein